MAAVDFPRWMIASSEAVWSAVRGTAYLLFPMQTIFGQNEYNYYNINRQRALNSLMRILVQPHSPRPISNNNPVSGALKIKHDGGSEIIGM